MRINLVHDKDNIKWIYFKLTSNEMNLDNWKITFYDTKKFDNNTKIYYLNKYI